MRLGLSGQCQTAWGCSAILPAVERILGGLQLSIAPIDSLVVMENVHASQLTEATRASYSYFIANELLVSC